MLHEHTPIERHEVRGREIWVKRDDLVALPPAPPIAKLRGIADLLSRAASRGYTLVGCFEARVSRIGHGLAAACAARQGLRCIVAYPKIKGQPPPASVMAAANLGARILPIPSNFVAICYRQAARVVGHEGGWMLPFGFECPEAIAAVAREAETIPTHYIEDGTLVVSCGSGVTLAGILCGLRWKPKRVVGVSVGRSVANIERCLDRSRIKVPAILEIRAPTRPFHEPATLDCPFSCDVHYDLKAWEVLVQELDSFPDPILFWNVGGR